MSNMQNWSYRWHCKTDISVPIVHKVDQVYWTYWLIYFWYWYWKYPLNLDLLRHEYLFVRYPSFRWIISSPISTRFTCYILILCYSCFSWMMKSKVVVKTKKQSCLLSLFFIHTCVSQPAPGNILFKNIKMERDGIKGAGLPYMIHLGNYGFTRTSTKLWNDWFENEEQPND